jgi:hypothetical protein
MQHNGHDLTITNDTPSMFPINLLSPPSIQHSQVRVTMDSIDCGTSDTDSKVMFMGHEKMCSHALRLDHFYMFYYWFLNISLAC